MRILPARPPTPADYALVILLPVALLAGVVWAITFGLLASASLTIHRAALTPRAAATEAMGAAMVALAPAAIALVCMAAGAINNRRMIDRARWLAGVARVTRGLAIALAAAVVADILCIGAAAFIAGAGVGVIGLLALGALGAAPVLALLPRAGPALRRIALGACWHDRRFCTLCEYDITGLARCPECGATRPRALRPERSARLLAAKVSAPIGPQHGRAGRAGRAR